MLTHGTGRVPLIWFFVKNNGFQGRRHCLRCQEGSCSLWRDIVNAKRIIFLSSMLKKIMPRKEVSAELEEAAAEVVIAESEEEEAAAVMAEAIIYGKHHGAKTYLNLGALRVRVHSREGCTKECKATVNFCRDTKKIMGVLPGNLPFIKLVRSSTCRSTCTDPIYKRQIARQNTHDFFLYRD